MEMAGTFTVMYTMCLTKPWTENTQLVKCHLFVKIVLKHTTAIICVVKKVKCDDSSFFSLRLKCGHQNRFAPLHLTTHIKHLIVLAFCRLVSHSIVNSFSV